MLTPQHCWVVEKSRKLKCWKWESRWRERADAKQLMREAEWKPHLKKSVEKSHFRYGSIISLLEKSGWVWRSSCWEELPRASSMQRAGERCYVIRIRPMRICRLRMHSVTQHFRMIITAPHEKIPCENISETLQYADLRIVERAQWEVPRGRTWHESIWVREYAVWELHVTAWQARCTDKERERERERERTSVFFVLNVTLGRASNQRLSHLHVEERERQI